MTVKEMIQLLKSFDEYDQTLEVEILIAPHTTKKAEFVALYRAIDEDNQDIVLIQ